MSEAALMGLKAGEAWEVLVHDGRCQRVEGRVIAVLRGVEA